MARYVTWFCSAVLVVAGWLVADAHAQARQP